MKHFLFIWTANVPKLATLGLVSVVSTLAFAANDNMDVKYRGVCTILRQPTKSSPGKLLARVDISLKSGGSQTIYQDGKVSYEVVLLNTGDLYTLEALVTRGTPRFIAAGFSTFTETAVTQGVLPGVGVASPHFLTFGCGPNP